MEHVKNSSNLDRSRDCWNFLHAARNYAGYFFYKTWKLQGTFMGTFCWVTMQLPLFELRLKTFLLLSKHNKTLENVLNLTTKS